MNNLYDEYALLEAEIAERELKKEQLRPLILEQMIENDKKKIETAIGVFSVSKRKKWTYPKVVLDIGEEFKAAQAKAQSTGEATFEETQLLVFTKLKL